MCRVGRLVDELAFHGVVRWFPRARWLGNERRETRRRCQTLVVVGGVRVHARLEVFFCGSPLKLGLESHRMNEIFGGDLDRIYRLCFRKFDK
jgi:hypothetical protein